MRSLLFPACRAKNNEEYRAVLKKRRISFCLFILAGMATAGIILFLHFCAGVEFTDYQLGYLLGMSAGLALGGVIGAARICLRMNSEEKLKEFRLKETDERELEVASLALRATAKLLLAAVYVVLIVAGVFGNEKLLYVCFGLIIIFLSGYTVFRKYYETRI